MHWVILEVVIGLAFLFLLLSVLSSAVNEAIAGLLGLRARTLEKGIANLLTGSSTSKKNRQGAELVEEFFDHAIVQSYRKDGKKPSYLASRTFRNAVLDLNGLLDVTSAPGDADPIRLEDIRKQVEAQLKEITDANAHLGSALTAIWRSADRDVTEFRAAVERWFDREMERVTGWYKRQAQVILFAIGMVLAILLNASAVTAADNLWKDDGNRQALVIASNAQASAPSAGDAFHKLETLPFPIGWEKANRPSGIDGWALNVIGWLLSGIAVTLGAPFWFDVLNRVSNLRTAGLRPASVLAPSDDKKVAGIGN